jgi:hypothetical protein
MESQQWRQQAAKKVALALDFGWRGGTAAISDCFPSGLEFAEIHTFRTRASL